MGGITLPDPLGSDLMNALGLPKMTFAFNLRVRIDRFPTVTVQFYPDELTVGKDGTLVTCLKRYELREIWDHDVAEPILPTPPQIEIHSEHYVGPMCPLCNSDYPKRFWLFGRRVCVNPHCRNEGGDPPPLPAHFDLKHPIGGDE